MINRIPKSIFLFASFLLLLAMYWPSMHGLPVWDDLSYMFKYDVVTKDFSYLTIFKDFAWPLSVSFQKVLFHWWGHNYTYYHLLNVGLHFLNAFLLLKVADFFKISFSRILFLIFLLHPSNVISVSWMIQLKTLMCFLFAITSFLFLIKAQNNKRWYLLSWVFFLFSLLSKSASLPLCVFFFFFSYKQGNRKDLLWLIPFFVFSVFSGFRTIESSVTKKALGHVETKLMKPIDAETSSRVQKKPIIEKAAPTVPTVRLPVSPTPVTAKKEKILIHLEKIVLTAHYYFWQTLLPLKNQPVKGLHYSSPGTVEYFHIIFILLVVGISWGSLVNAYLGFGYLMMLPFLGIFSAPYMNLAWVSDQHLYLALPFFLCLWLTLLSKWKMKFSAVVPLLYLPLCCYLLLTSTPYYQNEIGFYKASLEADALNVPMAYNLAVSYVQKGDLNQAINVTNTMVNMAEIAPELHKNKYYPYIYFLHSDLQRVMNKKQK
jgi:hypothetical protein